MVLKLKKKYKKHFNTLPNPLHKDLVTIMQKIVLQVAITI